MSSDPVLQTLSSARQIADHAHRVGIAVRATNPRPSSAHVGAVLADCILQAGLNYRTVVKARIDRIVINFPEASRLSGVRKIIESGRIGEFLLWHHPTKITRFLDLVRFLNIDGVDDVSDLRSWLVQTGARNRLLSLHGIGPKTYDYLCCLTGVDCIAVDRHIRTFAEEAGVLIDDYDRLKAVVSYAADLLGISRRDFDACIWEEVSRRAQRSFQYSTVTSKPPGTIEWE